MENLTKINSEYVSVLEDRSFRLTAERLLIKCGVRADLKGSKCLTDAIILFGTELCESFCEIYRIIGAGRNIKPKSVMREIAYVIQQAFDLPTRLSAMIGVDIPEQDIHPGLVIAYLGRVFRNPELSVYS